MKKYNPSDPSIWKGRVDGGNSKRIHEIVLCRNIDDEDLIPNTYGILGFCSDEGIRRNLGRAGAKEGPLSFRYSFAKLPATVDRIYDFGDVTCDDQNLEESQIALSKCISKLYQKGIFPIVIGGGHEVAWGHYLGIKDHFSNFAILNIDAHFDLRPLAENKLGNSGTPFTQIADDLEDKFHYYCLGIQQLSNTELLFDEAKKRKVQFLFANQIDGKQEMAFVDEILKKHQQIYLTICMDAFAAPFAPGVSAPQPLGLLPQSVLPLLSRLSESGKVIAFNIAELSPPYDLDDITASLAANLVMLFIPKRIYV